MPTSFAVLGVSNAVCDALSRRGVTAPFPVQELVIGDVLAGRDVLVKSPTGSGKTLAFGVPMVERIDARGPRPSALVLAPTRELATQIVEELRGVAQARALQISAVYGGVGLHKQAVVAARSSIVVATPGRLEDLLQRGAFSLAQVRILVLDEADRMLDMGFRPAVDRIVARCPRERQTLFFSATLDGVAGNVAAAYTRDAIVHAQGRAGSRSPSEIEHQRFVAALVGDDRVEALVGELSCRARARARVRSDQTGSRPSRRATRRAWCRSRRNPRKQVPAPARTGAGTVRVRSRRHARRHRHRGSRPRRAGHLARHQLRSARRPRHLCSPRRANRTRRPQRSWDHARRQAGARRRGPARRRARHRARPHTRQRGANAQAPRVNKARARPQPPSPLTAASEAGGEKRLTVASGRGTARRASVLGGARRIPLALLGGHRPYHQRTGRDLLANQLELFLATLLRSLTRGLHASLRRAGPRSPVGLEMLLKAVGITRSLSGPRTQPLRPSRQR